MIVSLPPGSENLGLALLDLIRNPDAYEKALQGFVEEREKCTAAQKELSATTAKNIQDAADNQAATEQIAKDRAEILVMRDSAERRLSAVVQREAEHAAAVATFGAKAKETDMALANRTAAVEEATAALARARKALEATST